MAYKPILAPEEFHAWLQALAKSRGVSMATIMREMAAEGEQAEASNAAPVAVTVSSRKAAHAQTVPA